MSNPLRLPIPSKRPSAVLAVRQILGRAFKPVTDVKFGWSTSVKSLAAPAAALIAILCSSPVNAAETQVFSYKPDSLPDQSDPRWERTGGPVLQTDLLDGILQVQTASNAWGQWMLGQAPEDVGREFGDASALPIEKGGAVTLDFRVRIPDPSTPSDVPCFFVQVSNGVEVILVTFFADRVEVAGQTPQSINASEWADYRIVIEGNQGAFYASQSATVLKIATAREVDYGRAISFGIPGWEGSSDSRGFELQALRWYPNQALYDPPQDLAP